MDQNLHTAETYDFRQYDRIWQRVAPGLEPYPVSQGDSVPPPAPAAVTPQGTGTALSPVQTRQEGSLPGAAPNPCCMGSAAAEMLNVLTGFAETALETQRQLLALLRQAPAWARQSLRDMAAENGAQAKRLMAVYYLITGNCYRPVISTGPLFPQRWCPALRERYHAAACSGFNYARAAEGTTDPCLAKLLEELSREAYRQSETLLELLERSLRS